MRLCSPPRCPTFLRQVNRATVRFRSILPRPCRRTRMDRVPHQRNLAQHINMGQPPRPQCLHQRRRTPTDLQPFQQWGDLPRSIVPPPSLLQRELRRPLRSRLRCPPIRVKPHRVVSHSRPHIITARRSVLRQQRRRPAMPLPSSRQRKMQRPCPHIWVNPRPRPLRTTTDHPAPVLRAPCQRKAYTEPLRLLSTVTHTNLTARGTQLIPRRMAARSSVPLRASHPS